MVATHLTFSCRSWPTACLCLCVSCLSIHIFILCPTYLLLYLVYQIKSYADIRLVAIKTLRFKYILTPVLIVWIRISVFVWLTHETLSYDPSSCTHDEMRESTAQRLVLKCPRPGLQEETRTTTWYGRSRFQTFVVLTSCSCRSPDVLFLPTSWRLVPADVLTSCSCRRPDVAFLSSSSSSWRHAPADVLTSSSCRRLRRLDVTRRRPDVAFLSSSPTNWRHIRVWRSLDVNSSSSRSLSAFRARDALVVSLATHGIHSDNDKLGLCGNE